jgi:hypothetical protein
LSALPSSGKADFADAVASQRVEILSLSQVVGAAYCRPDGVRHRRRTWQEENEGAIHRLRCLLEGRHRQLLLAVAEGRQLAELAQSVSDATGVTCRVLTPIGTHVVEGPHPLPRPDLDRVTATFLSADRFPAVVAGQDLTAYTVFPVGSALGQRLTSWFIVAEGTWTDWDPDITDALGEMAAIAALERARQNDALRFDRQRADELFALIEAGAGGHPEAVTRLRQAGLEPDLPLMVVDAGFAGRPELVKAACHLLANLSTHLGSPAVVAARPPWATVVLPCTDRATDEIRAVMERLLPGLPPPGSSSAPQEPRTQVSWPVPWRAPGTRPRWPSSTGPRTSASSAATR